MSLLHLVSFTCRQAPADKTGPPAGFRHAGRVAFASASCLAATALLLTVLLSAINVVHAQTPSAPTAADKAVMTDEDTAYTFTASDFSFADADGDSLAGVTIASLPTAGTLKLDGTAVTEGQSVPAADIGKLVFTPEANATGRAMRASPSR